MKFDSKLEESFYNNYKGTLNRLEVPKFTYYNKYRDDKKHIYTPDFYDKDNKLVIEVKSLLTLVGPSWNYWDNNIFKFLEVLNNGYNLLLHLDGTDYIINTIDDVYDIVKDYDLPDNCYESVFPYTFKYVNCITGEIVDSDIKLDLDQLVERTSSKDSVSVLSKKENRFIMISSTNIHKLNMSVFEITSPNKDRVWLYKDDTYIMVPNILLNNYLNDNWIKKSNISNTIWMSKDNKLLRVKSDEVKNYLLSGYTYQGPSSNTKWMSNGTDYKMVKNNEIDDYESNGWVFKTPNDNKRWLRSPAGSLTMVESSDLDYYLSIGYELDHNLLGKICVHKDGINEYIDADNIDEYINNGYKLGNNLSGVNDIREVNTLKYLRVFDYENYLYPKYIKGNNALKYLSLFNISSSKFYRILIDELPSIDLSENLLINRNFYLSINNCVYNSWIDEDLVLNYFDGSKTIKFKNLKNIKSGLELL